MNHNIPKHIDPDYGDGRDITPEDDEHIKWINSGFRMGYQKAKREQVDGKGKYDDLPLKEWCGCDDCPPREIDGNNPTGQNKPKGIPLDEVKAEYMHEPKFREAYALDYKDPNCTTHQPQPKTGQSKKPAWMTPVHEHHENCICNQPQPNTDSLETRLGLILRELSLRQRASWSGLDNMPNATEDAITAIQELFNKYAREIIGEDDWPGVRQGPDERMDEHTRGWYEGRNQLRQEQRAKLKGEGNNK